MSASCESLPRHDFPRVRLPRGGSKSRENGLAPLRQIRKQSAIPFQHRPQAGAIGRGTRARDPTEGTQAPNGLVVGSPPRENEAQRDESFIGGTGPDRFECAIERFGRRRRRAACQQ